MLRHLLMTAACLPALAVASCAETPSERWSPSEVSYRNELLHLETRHDVHFADLRSGRISAEEALRLGRFLEASLADRPGAAITLQELGPAGQAAAVEAFLVDQGFPSQAIRRAARPAVAAPEPRVAVAVTRVAVVPPACGDWSRPAELSIEQTVFSNFGCATTRALGLMVADPADLEAGAPTSPAVGGRELLAVGRYLEGSIPPLPASEGFVEQ